MWVELVSRTVLIEWMSYRGETCRSLAVKAGVHPSLIGFLRGGHRKTCSPQSAKAIEKVLMVPPGALFTPKSKQHTAVA